MPVMEPLCVRDASYRRKSGACSHHFKVRPLLFHQPLSTSPISTFSLSYSIAITRAIIFLPNNQHFDIKICYYHYFSLLLWLNYIKTKTESNWIDFNRQWYQLPAFFWRNKRIEKQRRVQMFHCHSDSE